MTKTGSVGVSALRAGMSRNTATKYLKSDDLPSDRDRRSWRTRADPFEEHWPWIVEQLREEPGFEAKTLFEDLLERHPDRYQIGQLRTLQRRIKQWRATEGPDRELHLPQEHRPGEAMQTDFTWMNSLSITIASEPYEHMLCHCALPYSNWSWAVPCRSESLAALRKGVPAALTRLGRRPRIHQTDNSTAATHSLASGKRDFNDDYVALMRQVGMDPRTIAVGKKEQNGDIEAANGALKRHIEQQLLLRGHRDFDSHDDYVSWLSKILARRNKSRSKRLLLELSAMRPLRSVQIPEYTELPTRVTGGGTVSVMRSTYSVPSRLRDQNVRVRVFDDHIEVFFGGQRQLSAERVRGRGGSRIDYRHVVHSLLRKPGGFRRYRYRDDLFPTDVFRRAYDVLDRSMDERKADIEYLRLLHLAAMTMESDVEDSLLEQLESGVVPSSDRVRDRVAPTEPEAPMIIAPVADLSSYDNLLSEATEALS